MTHRFIESNRACLYSRNKFVKEMSKKGKTSVWQPISCEHPVIRHWFCTTFSPVTPYFLLLLDPRILQNIKNSPFILAVVEFKKVGITMLSTSESQVLWKTNRFVSWLVWVHRMHFASCLELDGLLNPTVMFQNVPWARHFVRSFSGGVCGHQQVPETVSMCANTTTVIS